MIYDHEALIEVSQFISQLYTSLIAQNDSFAKTIGYNPETYDSFRDLWIEDLNAYKVYDCWWTFN